MSSDLSSPKIELGPFTFHLTGAMTMRLVATLPDNPTFKDVRDAIIRINAEDAAVKVQS